MTTENKITVFDNHIIQSHGKICFSDKVFMSVTPPSSPNQP